MTIRVAATIVLAALLIPAVAVAAVATPPVQRVVVVLAPYLTWDDVMHGPMPATRAIAGRGLVADMNVRSGAVGAGAPSLARGALMISAGASALAVPEAASSYSASEPVGGYTARDVYRQRFGASPGSSEVLFLGLPEQATGNAVGMLENTIGALGTAAAEAGVRTFAIGNSDPGFDAEPARRSRPAGVVAADEAGRVSSGDVSTQLLVDDPAAPFGVRTDIARLEAACATALTIPGRSLIVIDPGDLARAYDAASVSTTGAAEAAHRAAVGATDRVVASVSKDLDPRRDLLVVLAPVAPEVPDQPPAFVPVIMLGPGGAGLATAASTHRDGIVTVMDVSATIVEAMGVTPITAMVGSPIVRVAASPSGLAGRVALLERMNDTAVAIELVRVALVNTFIITTVIVLLGSALILYRGARDLPSQARTVARALLVLIPCLPLASVLEFAVWSRPPSAFAVLGLLIAVAAVVWGAALLSGRGRHVALPLIVVSGLTTIVLVVDQWLGAPLSFAGTFGYSPLYGARYYGIGNEMAGLLLGSAMVACALVLDTWRDAGWVRHVRNWGWPALGAIVLLASAAPFFGANIGAVAWMTVGFLVGWLLLTGRRVWTWRNALIVVVAVVIIVAGLAAIDLLGTSGSVTHLGRAIRDASGAGGLSGLWALVARKADTNLRVFGRTNWTWLLLAVLLLLGYMRWRPRGEFAAMLRENPAYSAALGAALFAGVVGYFTEDSGIIIPALIMVPIGVTAMYLMLVRNGEDRTDGEAT